MRTIKLFSGQCGLPPLSYHMVARLSASQAVLVEVICSEIRPIPRDWGRDDDQSIIVLDFKAGKKKLIIKTLSLILRINGSDKTKRGFWHEVENQTSV